MSTILGKAISKGGGLSTVVAKTNAGAVVTAMLGSKTVTAVADSDGNARLSLNTAGTWTIIATLDGQTTGEVTVVVPSSLALIFPPVANTTPTSGITYTSGIASLDAANLSTYAKAISNNAGISSTTNTVYIDDIKNKKYYKIDVANQINISLNGTTYAFDVIGFNHDTLTDSTAYGEITATGKAGITFQMHDLFATAYVMNSSSTNVGGWKSCLMRTSTMPIMKSYLPSAWQSAIKPVNKNTSVGNGLTNIETVSDYCFLLAEIEIFGATTYAAPGEGMQYAYYKADNSKVKNRDGVANSWWERSPSTYNPTYFAYVNKSGAADGFYHSTAGDGVAFGFCV